MCFFTKDIHEFGGNNYDGVIFTGDLLFRRSKGIDDGVGCDKALLNNNLREKIMYNPDLTDNFLVLPGHEGETTIDEERSLNPFGKEFLSKPEWKANKWYKQYTNCKDDKEYIETLKKIPVLERDNYILAL